MENGIKEQVYLEAEKIKDKTDVFQIIHGQHTTRNYTWILVTFVPK